MVSKPGEFAELTGKLQEVQRAEESGTPKSDSNHDLQDDTGKSFTKSASGNSQDRNATNPPPDRLCASCSRINFDPPITQNGPSHKIAVRLILANKACASCRLIACLIPSDLRAKYVSESMNVSLLLRKYYFQPRSPTASFPIVRLGKPFWLEVILCSQERNQGQRHGGVRYPLGSLLPVQEEVERGHTKVFSTSEHKGSIYARPVPETVDVGMLRNWIKFCDETHHRCTDGVLHGDDTMRIRLIDVQERRLVNSTLKQKYLALSYVWGDVTNKVLMKDTLEQYQCGGSLTEAVLPLIVSNAMDLVAELGERYLWADTVCIKQDDEDDKQSQLPFMDAIYSHAKLVLIAIVNGANERLPRWRESLQSAKQHSEVLVGQRFSTAQPSLSNVLSNAVWGSRGWTFQEGLLARRALIFTDHQVHWSCLEDSWCEDRHTEFKDIRNVPTAYNSLCFPFAFFDQVRRDNPSDELNRAFSYEMLHYAQLVQDYSQREFSDSSDAFWAFIGVLRRLKDQFPKGYIWALPYSHLDLALLWQTRYATELNPKHVIPCADGTFREITIPSWCWAAKGHRVWYEPRCDHVIFISRVTWHEPIQHIEEYEIMTSDRSQAEDTQSSVFVDLGGVGIKSRLVNYALLHFTAQTAFLHLGLYPQKPSMKTFGWALEEDYTISGHYMVMACIQLPSGVNIGEILVPPRVLHDGMEKRREFILLSDETPKPPDGQNLTEQSRCKHWPASNIMLIEWRRSKKGTNFAVRVAVGKIEQRAWREVEPTEKDIILA